MARQVAIVHGWSDTSKSFIPLVEFLKKNGFGPVPLWLGDYISLDDDVKVEDVAKRMHRVIREMMSSGDLDQSFDLIVHSTGGLVARQWLATYYPDGKGRDDRKPCPVRRLVMLAPANFGSKLATMGQSMLGRVVKGWKNWFHTGKEMLTGLELASNYQWDLAQRDLFLPEAESGASPYLGDGVLPFVIVGTHPYTNELRQIVNENGADGTVRVPAANLNVRGITVDFSINEEVPVKTEWKLRHGNEIEFPLAVLPDRTHGSIITPDNNEVTSNPTAQAQLGKLILEALNCASLVAYGDVQKAWEAITEETASLALDDAKRKAFFPRRPVLDLFKGDEPAAFFNQYMQVVVRVVDDHGVDVQDFFLEFFGPDSKTDAEAIYFHSKVLEEAHVNGSGRCLYVDRTDLIANYYARIPEGKPKVVAMSVSASPPGDNISYFTNLKIGAAGHVIVHHEDETQGRWLRRNCTHFVKMIIPRTPKDGVFKLTKS
jgi:pimeloyl-ACP methyl ester carboxylesterase